MDERLTRNNSFFGRGASGHSNEEYLSAKGNRGAIDSSSRILLLRNTLAIQRTYHGQWYLPV